MGKFLLLVVLAVAMILWWRAAQRRAAKARRDEASSAAPAQRMIRCEHCAVHGPETEMLVADGLHFCCENHRDEYFRRHPRSP